MFDASKAPEQPTSTAFSVVHGAGCPLRQPKGKERGPELNREAKMGRNVSDWLRGFARQ
jgi:hypothetical protein